MLGDLFIIFGDAKHGRFRGRIVKLFGDKPRCRRAPVPVCGIVKDGPAHDVVSACRPVSVIRSIGIS
jgi:hypothetical protein